MGNEWTGACFEMPNDARQSNKKRAVVLDGDSLHAVVIIERLVKSFALSLRLPDSAVVGFIEDVLTAYRKATQEGCAENAHKPMTDQNALLTTYRRFGDRSLPALPPSLAWPQTTYSRSPEAERGGGGIVAYLEREWLALLQAGIATRRVLELVDPSAIRGIENFTRINRPTGERKKLPAHLHFPTLKEIHDAILASAPEAARIAINRYQRTYPARRRIKRAAE